MTEPVSVTPTYIEDNIASEHYFNAGDAAFPGDAIAEADWIAYESLKLLTFCIIVMTNGYTVVGKSACVDPRKFNEELGRQIARQDAINQIWPLLGFKLKDEMMRNEMGVV